MGRPRKAAAAMTTRAVDESRALYRRKVDTLIEANDRHIEEHGKGMPGFREQLEAVKLAATMAGVDPRSLATQRSEAEMFAETAERFFSEPESLCEATDDFLDRLESEMEKAAALCHKRINELAERASDIPVEPDRVSALTLKAERGKAWAGRVSRLRRIRQMAREPRPHFMLARHLPSPPEIRKRWTGALEASHILRFQLYVGRSNINKKDGQKFYQVGWPHVCMAVACWEADNGIHFHRDGMLGGDHTPASFQRNIRPFEGVIIVLPPGHGKSEYMTHRRILRIDLNPRTQAVVLHRTDEIASEMLKYTQAAFHTGEAVGRRNLALFPNLRLAKTDNTAKKMRLDLDETLRAPTLVSNGVRNKRTGINASEISFDDVVDQEDAAVESVREEIKERVGGTWMTRLRGQIQDRSWDWVGTIWHESDALSHYLKLSGAFGSRAQLHVKVLIMPCGGPSERFKPIWPEMYSAAYLRNKYQTLGPRLYAAAYQCNPFVDSATIVKRIRLYPTAPKPDASPDEVAAFYDEAAHFTATAVRHVSVDPAATNREGADKAGLVYAAVGDVVRKETTPDGAERSESRRRCRIIEARRESANQLEIVEIIAGFASTSPVDFVHVETVGGLHATADLLESKYEIDVIRHKTGSKNKEVRLRRVAAMLDDSGSGSGAPAVVEFPGAWGVTADGGHELAPRDDVKWLVDEVTRYPFSATDDGLDALTQLCGHLVGTGEFEVGDGIVSERIRRTEETPHKSRMRGFFARLAERERPADSAQADYEWFKEASKWTG